MTPVLSNVGDAGATAQSTVTLEEHLTSPGIAVGTIAYMSPEQIRAKQLDARTDLFSFGAVLYEMATGAVPFRGESTGVVFESILNRTAVPPIRANPDVPADLERIITKSLEKDRNLRYQHAADILTDLKRLKRDRDSSHSRAVSEAPSSPSTTPTDVAGGRPSSGTVLLAEARRHKGALAIVLVAGAVLVTALGIYWSRVSGRRTEWNLQSMKISRVTQSGNAANVAISPDGHYIVYALVEGEKQSLNVRQVATGSDVQILPPDEVGIYGLAFSPDGNYIDFVRSEKNNPYNTYLYRMPVLGGAPHLVMQKGIDGSNSYSPDGTQFAFLRVGADNNTNLLIAQADGSKERVLATRPDIYVFGAPAWSPDGKTVAFATLESAKGIRSVLWAVSVADGSVREFYSTPGFIGRPRWLPDGSGLVAPLSDLTNDVYANFRGQLWFISFPGGEVHRLTNDLMAYMPDLDLTQDGKTLVDTEQTTESDLWVEPAGGTTQAKQITAKELAVASFCWAPDGGIVFGSADGNLFSLSPGGTGRTLLTPNERGNSAPSVCGDGRYIVYAADRDQKRGIWRMEADGSNPTRIADETAAASPYCSPDGKWVVYVRFPNLLPLRVPIKGATPPEALAPDTETGSGLLGISPDGKRIAYLAFASNSTGGSMAPSASQPLQVKIIPFEGGAPLHQFDWPASAGGGRWGPGGDTVDYVLTRNGVSNIWEQKLTGGPPRQITNFQSEQIFDFQWSHDGKQLALSRGSKSSNVILISNFH